MSDASNGHGVNDDSTGPDDALSEAEPLHKEPPQRESLPDDVEAPTSPSAAPSDTDSPEVAAMIKEMSADFTELELLTKERDDYLDALRRTQADFENYRKRMQREATEARDAGAASLAGKLVDVLDTVDLALAHEPSDAVAQIATAMVDALGKEGLTRIDALGAPFDPEVHEAVLHEEGDGPAEVIEVLRSGWRWRDKVLRAAMVKVKGS